MHLHECTRLRARITLAQCEHNRNRSDRHNVLGTPVRPRACEGCTDWKQWTEENVMTDIDRIIERMMQASGAKTRKELGEIVGGNVYSAKQNGRVPEPWFTLLRERYGASEVWLKTGSGEKPDGLPAPDAAATTEVETRQPDEQASDETAAQALEAEAQTEAPLAVPDVDRTAYGCLAEVPTEVVLAELLDRMPWMTITIKGHAA